MANHNLPTQNSGYLNFVTELDARFDDLCVGLDPARVTLQNLPTNSVGWSSAGNRWQRWTGTTWTDLATTYSISISGNAATATTATTLANARTISLTGDVSYTSPGFNGSGNVTAVATLANTGVVAGTYSISSIAVDLKGRVTSAASTATSGTGSVVLTNNPTLTGYTETVFSLSGTSPTISALNGTIQTWFLTSNSTPINGLTNGQSVSLMINDGPLGGSTITWPSVTWKTEGGLAPTLNTSGFTDIILWQVGTTLYGARVGDA